MWLDIAQGIALGAAPCHSHYDSIIDGKGPVDLVTPVGKCGVGSFDVALELPRPKSVLPRPRKLITLEALRMPLDGALA